MSDTLALTLLYDAVSARFASDGTPCALAFGWRERAKQVTEPRIVMVPGDEQGTAGDIGAAKQPGRNPRSLANFAELFHVVVSGAGDATDPTNERKAYAATRYLFDAWYRAAWLWSGNRMQFQNAAWLVERTANRFGCALVATFTMDAMIPDLPYPSLIGQEESDPTSARITANMLNRAEIHYVELAEYIATESGLVIGTEGGEELQYNA
jgi:hypothetical protein